MLEVHEFRFKLSGVALLQGAIAAGTIAELKTRAEAAFAARDARAAADPLETGRQRPYLRRFVNLEELAPIDELLPAAVLRLARVYLGHEPSPAPDRYVREIRPERVDTHLPYHQDQSILGRRLVNVWCPLSRAGELSPGLELVRCSQFQLLQPAPVPGSPYAVEKVRLAESDVRRRFDPALFWRPVVDAGDVLVFSGTTIHRTYGLPGMTQSRFSFEARLV
jgi:hypothetical protein